ncbi:hypothetical protein CK203_034624 [Vitis vinifera]|uniref:Uncharacterized protein n=1 Tax=Vitis vinifera TaxID=29760 RepID=A0A438IDX5_VITVI|nr:hypothetical protein CK203_034624 [Vitis vinifera]
MGGFHWLENEREDVGVPFGSFLLLSTYTSLIDIWLYLFIAGKLYQWILRQQEGGSRVTTVDVLSYLQNELDYCGEEPPMSPRAPIAYQHAQQIMHLPSSGFLVSSGSSAHTNAGQGPRPEHCDQQPKNSVFSNALSSPVRRSLQTITFLREATAQMIAQVMNLLTENAEIAISEAACYVQNKHKMLVTCSKCGKPKWASGVCSHGAECNVTKHQSSRLNPVVLLNFISLFRGNALGMVRTMKNSALHSPTQGLYDCGSPLEERVAEGSLSSCKHVY